MLVDDFINAYKLFGIYPSEYLILKQLYLIETSDKKLISTLNVGLLTLSEMNYTGDDTLFGSRTEYLENLNLIEVVRDKNNIIKTIKTGNKFKTLIIDKITYLKELFDIYPKISKSKKSLLDLEIKDIQKVAIKYFESINGDMDNHELVLNFVQSNRDWLNYTFLEFINLKIWSNEK